MRRGLRCATLHSEDATASDQRESDMTVQERTNLRSVYLYLVCLVTLVMSIFATVSVVRNTVQLIYPDPGVHAYEPYYEPAGRVEMDAGERERREQAMRDSQRHSAIVGLVGSGAMLLIAGPAYLYHWRRVQSDLDASRRAPSPEG
jgi:uncharacterized membrane protein